MNNFNKRNQRDGLWEIYFKNGKLAYRGEYLNGIKIGFWIWNNNTYLCL